MRILIANSLYHPDAAGGAERSVSLLAEGLLAQNHAVGVLCLSRDERPSVEDIGGVTVYRIPLRNLYWPFSEDSHNWLRKVSWHILDSANVMMTDDAESVMECFEPDIVHSNNLYGLSIGVWRAAHKKAIPTVHTLRDYYLLCPRSMYSQKEVCEDQCAKCKAVTLPRRAYTRTVSGVVGISEFILREHERHGLFESVRARCVIYNPTATISAAKKSGEIEGAVRFGFIGRLVERKGVEWFLRVARSIDSEMAEFVIAGTGSREYIRELRSRYSSENITFVGFVDPEDFYSSIDVVVVPSLWKEPFGRVIAEAYNYGVPVVVSDRGGMPELVDDGETGLVIEAGSEAGLEEALQSIIRSKELRTKLSAKALAKGRNFDVGICVNQYCSIYNRLLNGAQRGG